jgi:2-polyprenyl-3-methyl-5-hydroxy-6-metoxy-1,4-benzoquinol methylase
MALSKYDIHLDLEQKQGTSHAMLVEMVGANKRVLDVGCDTGYLGEALSAFGNETSGFEVNEETAEQARKRLSRVEVGDLETTDLVDVFGPGSFDVVVFGDVLEHLRDPLPVLRQSRNLLAAGGSVVISTPNVAHGDVRLALLSGRFDYNQLGILDVTHTRFFTKQSLVDFLHDGGFVLAELQRTRAELFSTEIKVNEGDYDPALVEQLRADDEATTYQFVVRAVPDDATSLQSQQALELDRMRGELLQAQRSESSLRAEHDGLVQRVAELEARLAEVFAAHDAAVEQRDAAQDQLAAATQDLLRLRSGLRGLARRATGRFGAS